MAVTTGMGMAKKAIELDKVKLLLKDIPIILSFNEQLLEDLKPRIAMWAPHQQLGDIFVRIAFFLKIYTNYVNNYDAALNEMREAKKCSSKFNEFMDVRNSPHPHIHHITCTCTHPTPNTHTHAKSYDINVLFDM